MTHIDGVLFGDAWQRRVKGMMAGVEVNFISPEDLIRNKEASGRPSDLEQLRHLRNKPL